LWDRYEDVEIPMPVVTAAGVAPDDPHSARLRVAVDEGAVAVTDDQVLTARRAYLGNVSYVDDWTGRIVDTLSALSCADDTVIVVLADHGDMLGERGLWYKMNFFEGSARIPLVVHAPRRFAPRRVPDPVSLVDVLPTIVDLAGADLGEVAQVTPLVGSSLLPLCADESGADMNREVIGEYMAEGSVAPIVMIRRGTLKYVHCEADPDQLYDLSADPHELTNLAPEAAWAAKVAELRREVTSRWDLADLYQRVLSNQRSRRYVDRSLRIGLHTGWEYTPPRTGTAEYMRNHLDLNEVERAARWPRA
jgi:choline-sulfatase